MFSIIEKISENKVTLIAASIFAAATYGAYFFLPIMPASAAQMPIVVAMCGAVMTALVNRMENS